MLAFAIQGNEYRVKKTQPNKKTPTNPVVKAEI